MSLRDAIMEALKPGLAEQSAAAAFAQAVLSAIAAAEFVVVRRALSDKTLLEAAKAALKWADNIKSYEDAGPEIPAAFEGLRDAVEAVDIWP